MEGVSNLRVFSHRFKLQVVQVCKTVFAFHREKQTRTEARKEFLNFK